MQRAKHPLRGALAFSETRRHCEGQYSPVGISPPLGVPPHPCAVRSAGGARHRQGRVDGIAGGFELKRRVLTRCCRRDDLIGLDGPCVMSATGSLRSTGERHHLGKGGVAVHLETQREAQFQMSPSSASGSSISVSSAEYGTTAHFSPSRTTAQGCSGGTPIGVVSGIASPIVVCLILRSSVPLAMRPYLPCAVRRSRCASLPSREDLTRSQAEQMPCKFSGEWSSPGIRWSQTVESDPSQAIRSTQIGSRSRICSRSDPQLLGSRLRLVDPCHAFRAWSGQGWICGQSGCEQVLAARGTYSPASLGSEDDMSSTRRARSVREARFSSEIMAALARRLGHRAHPHARAGRGGSRCRP